MSTTIIHYVVVHLVLLAIHLWNALKEIRPLMVLLHVCPHLVDPMQNVVLMKIDPYAPVSLECLVHRQIADPSASSIRTVPIILLAYNPNALIHALVHVVTMPGAVLKIIVQFVSVMKVTREMLALDAIAQVSVF